MFGMCCSVRQKKILHLVPVKKTKTTKKDTVKFLAIIKKFGRENEEKVSRTGFRKTYKKTELPCTTAGNFREITKGLLDSSRPCTISK